MQSVTTRPSDPAPPEPPFRLLALSGGGFLGLFTAQVLAGLEERADQPFGHRFDLLAGTSIGAVLALGLAFEVPMARIANLFVERGGAVFSEHDLPAGAVRRLLDLTRSVLGPKYSGAALRTLLEEQFGDARLGEARHPVIVPAVDVERSRTKTHAHAVDRHGGGAVSACAGHRTGCRRGRLAFRRSAAADAHLGTAAACLRHDGRPPGRPIPAT